MRQDAIVRLSLLLLLPGGAVGLTACGGDQWFEDEDTAANWGEDGGGSGPADQVSAKLDWQEGTETDAHLSPDTWYVESWMDGAVAAPGSNCKGVPDEAAMWDVRTTTDHVTDWVLLENLIVRGDYAAGATIAGEKVFGQGPGVMRALVQSECWLEQGFTDGATGSVSEPKGCWGEAWGTEPPPLVHHDFQQIDVTGTVTGYEARWDTETKYFQPRSLYARAYTGFYFEVDDEGNLVNNWPSMASEGDPCAENYATTWDVSSGAWTYSFDASTSVGAGGGKTASGRATFGVSASYDPQGVTVDQGAAEHFIQFNMQRVEDLTEAPAGMGTGDGRSYYSYGSAGVRDSAGGLTCVPGLGQDYLLVPIKEISKGVHEAALVARTGSSSQIAGESSLHALEIVQQGAVDKLTFQSGSFTWGMFPDHMTTLDMAELGLDGDFVPLASGRWLVETEDPMEPAVVRLDSGCMDVAMSPANWGDAFKATVDYAPWGVSAEVVMWLPDPPDAFEGSLIERFVHVMLPGSSLVAVLPVQDSERGLWFSGGFQDYIISGYLSRQGDQVEIRELDVRSKRAEPQGFVDIWKEIAEVAGLDRLTFDKVTQ